MKLLLVILLLSMPAMAQRPQRIDTDRPHRTLSSSVLPEGRVQIETGVGLESDFDQLLAAPETLLRWSPIEWLEARLITDYMIPSYGDWGGGGYGRSAPDAGFTYGAGIKVQVARQSGDLPEVALIAHLVHAFDSFEEYGAAQFAPELRLAMGNRHQSGLSIGYNLGGKMDPWSKSWYGIYTFAVGFTYYSGLETYMEISGEHAFGERIMSSMSYDLGLSWPVEDNLQLDIAIGSRIAGAAPRFYFGLGASAHLPD